MAEIDEDWPSARRWRRYVSFVRPNWGAGWVRLGDAARNAGERDAASAAYRRATIVDPHYAEGWDAYVAFLCGTGAFDEARALVDMLPDGGGNEDGPDVRLLHRRALARLALAREEIRNQNIPASAMLAVTPEEKLAHRGAYSNIADRLDAALADVSRCLEAAPRNPEYVKTKTRIEREYANAFNPMPEDGTRTPTGLRFVAVGTIGRCNASCVHCPTGKASTADTPKFEMPMSLFRKLVEGMRAANLEVTDQI